MTTLPSSPCQKHATCLRNTTWTFVKRLRMLLAQVQNARLCPPAYRVAQSANKTLVVVVVEFAEAHSDESCRCACHRMEIPATCLVILLSGIWARRTLLRFQITPALNACKPSNGMFLDSSHHDSGSRTAALLLYRHRGEAYNSAFHRDCREYTNMHMHIC